MQKPTSFPIIFWLHLQRTYNGRRFIPPCRRYEAYLVLFIHNHHIFSIESDFICHQIGIRMQDLKQKDGTAIALALSPFAQQTAEQDRLRIACKAIWSPDRSTAAANVIWLLWGKMSVFVWFPKVKWQLTDEKNGLLPLRIYTNRDVTISNHATNDTI